MLSLSWSLYLKRIDNAIADNADFLETIIDVTQGFLMEEDDDDNDDKGNINNEANPDTEASNHQRHNVRNQRELFFELFICEIAETCSSSL